VNYDTPQQTAYYMGTSSGVLSAKIKNSDRIEEWVFGYLHKFHWLDFAGKNVRGIALILFGLGNVAVAGLGFTLFT
jgi:predicted phosphohydrolase